MSPRQVASGASTRIEAFASSSGAGALVQREPRATRRRAVLNQALQTLGELEGKLVREELAIAVELCRRQNAAAQAERQEALRFAKETRDSVKREA